jgi:hypothetical protein
MGFDETRAKMIYSTPKKKPYHKLQLEIYGDMEDITRHVGLLATLMRRRPPTSQDRNLELGIRWFDLRTVVLKELVLQS